MTRKATLGVLFVSSLVAGVWLFRPAAPPEVADVASCTSDASCSADVAPPAEPAASATAAPRAPETPATPPPPPPPALSARPAAKPAASQADGKALRDEADRLLAEGSVLAGIEKLREATEAAPTAKNHGDLGSLLERLTAVDEALVHLRQAAELDPGNADRWIALANAYYRAVNPGEAWKAEKRAKQAEPGLVLGRDKSGRRVRQGDSEPRKP